MIGDLTVLGLIAARGGSKGVPEKNLRKVAGRTLIERTASAARGARTLDRVILSSEDPKIISAAIAIGCEVPFIRPESLATDDACSMEVVRHALGTLPDRYDLIVLLQPTSPLRSSADIDAAVELCVRADAPACVSVTPEGKSPQLMYDFDAKGALRPIVPVATGATRRQDLPAVYAINGAVYVARVEWVMRSGTFMAPETVGYVMPKERSVDIDDELDLVVAEAIDLWQRRQDAAVESCSDEEDARLVKRLLKQV